MVRRISKPWACQTDINHIFTGIVDIVLIHFWVLKHLYQIVCFRELFFFFSWALSCCQVCVNVLLFCSAVFLLLHFNSKLHRKTHLGPLPSPLYLPMSVSVCVHTLEYMQANGVVLLQHDKHCRCRDLLPLMLKCTHMSGATDETTHYKWCVPLFQLLIASLIKDIHLTFHISCDY